VEPGASDRGKRRGNPSLTFALGLTTLRLTNDSDPGLVEFSRSIAEVLQRMMDKAIGTLGQYGFNNATAKIPVESQSVLRSSGTSPNFRITVASQKWPIARSPVRLKAIAPT
jgi:hypothetical protein